MITTTHIRSALVVAVVMLCAAIPLLARAQTASTDQLRATIKAEIMADPRSKDLTQAQIYSMVNALTIQAQEQGLTASQITYRPGSPTTSGSTLTACDDFTCSLGNAFGLNGSIPIIPIALFVFAALFILIYGLMREMGHPHAQG
jgi:hypothetical protein